MSVMGKRLIHQWMTILQDKNFSSMLCICLNPCNLRIACSFMLNVVLSARRRLFLRYRLLALVLVLVLLVTSICYYIGNSKCREKDSRQLLKSLCRSYKKGDVAGNLCAPMCDENNFHYVKCLNYREGKAIIYGHWNDQQIVLKTKHSVLTDRERLEIFDSEDQKMILSVMAEFVNMVRSTINFTFGIEPIKDNQKLFSKLWQSDSNFPVDLFFQTHDGQSVDNFAVKLAMMKSLWSLVQQDEYLFLQYYSENQFLPGIIGSCGHVYAMEYAPSTGVLEPTLFQWTGTHAFTWAERADIARKLLDLVKSTQADYQEPLYMCDIKGGNFGIASNGVVKPIDLDTVFFHSKLKETFQDTTCSIDKDCDFFDCQGVCDSKTTQCKPGVLNNNLQAVCAKIFCDSEDNLMGGLLHEPPAAHRAQIESSLRKCKNLVGEELKNTNQVHQELKQILSDSVKVNK